MSTKTGMIRTWHWRLLAAAAVVFGMVGMNTAALAQHVLVMVNGEPITNYDVEQRTRFHQVAMHKSSSRQEVLDELINEKLKVQNLRRYRLDITDREVESAYADMGRRLRMTAEQLTQALAQSQIASKTLKDRIRSDLAWQQLVRGKFQQSLQVRDKDVLDALANRKTEDKDQDSTGFEYTLRPILFMVVNKSQASMETRKKEAEALRARFNNCDDGIRAARSLRNVVVREPVRRTSADLPPVLRKVLDETTVGRLTNPEFTPQGVEIFALCARKETTIESALKQRIREELFAEKFQDVSKRYLQELRRQAMIELK